MGESMALTQVLFTPPQCWTSLDFAQVFSAVFKRPAPAVPKQDKTKAIQFNNTFRYISDLFSISNGEFGNYISTIYPSELVLKDTSKSTTEVCYLDARIKLGDYNPPFHVSIYDKVDDLASRIVNFPHMDSNIPTKTAYGVYISQLVRC